MKLYGFIKTFPVLAALLIAACGQDPIFYTISQEVAPTEPRIEGAPTNMVVFEHGGQPMMVVASGRLHWYAKPAGAGEEDPPVWDSGEHSIPQPGGKIAGLAVAGDWLYALCLSGSSVATTLRRISKNDDKWEQVSIAASDSEALSYPLLQAIHADSERLFAASRKTDADSYAILYLDESAGELKFLQGGTRMLTGAASDGTTHYLSTTGSGIYSVTEADLAAKAPAATQVANAADLSASKNLNVMGIISLDLQRELSLELPVIIAAARDGSLYQISVNGFSSIKTLGYYSSGALALWKDTTDSSKKTLLTGIQGTLTNTTSSAYTHGYLELDLNNGWQMLSQGGTDDTPGSNVEGISWQGSLTEAPASPQQYWAYYNSKETKSYIYDGTAWQTLRQEGVTRAPGSNKVDIVWQGSLGEAPASPALNRAYYNTTDAKSYIYLGTETWKLHQPGKDCSMGGGTITNNDRYAASLGKHPINHLFQTPVEIDSKYTLFASTQTAGLWSYRSRDGGEQWNAEE